MTEVGVIHIFIYIVFPQLFAPIYICVYTDISSESSESIRHSRKGPQISPRFVSYDWMQAVTPCSVPR